MIELETNKGKIVIELNHEASPVTSANFKDYVSSGYYDGLIFHRVIKDFMIQGGGMLPGLIEKDAGESIKNEADNGLKNEKYTIAMARTADPHSASSQFFINTEDNDFLDFKFPSGQGWGYCVFGKVIEGQDVVDEIEKVETDYKNGHDDVPVEDVIILKAKVLSK